MSRAKKSAVPPVPKPDIVLLCRKCPGSKQIVDNGSYIPGFQCPECRAYFEHESPTMVANTDLTNEELRQRAPRITEFRLEEAKKVIVTKDTEIAKLKDRIESYERAMSLLGGGGAGLMLRGRTVFGIPY